MCKWKDERQLRRSYWKANTEKEIDVASAILALTDPQAYGVIDKRVWQVLYLYGEVNYNPEGTGLSVGHWIDYLPEIRQWASEFGVYTRNIERSLFEYHKTIQKGAL